MEFEKQTLSSKLETTGDEYGAMNQDMEEQKSSHVCCGCCCDTKRAVIVVNIISLSFALVAIISISMLTSAQYASQFDDDEVQAVLNEIDGAAAGMTIGYATLGMVFNSLGIFGAVKFQSWAVLLSGVWYIVDVIRGLLFFDIPGTIVAACFAYPHFVLAQEIRRGILSPATYQTEQQCCICC